ncbi:MAG TPA: 4Fe-4S binding protein [Candidatus Gallacutalibacter stercoravium]|nr:4Fe-4S binding protein [Candidatus Gallacutalibacter stercoravium]
MTVNNEDIKRVKAMGFLFNRESEDEFSARVITENGTLTGDQLHNIADAAQRFGNGTAAFTARLTVELPGISYGDIPALQEHLAQAGLETGGTGAKVRPVVACKGTTCVFGQIDTQAIAKQIHDRFYKGYGNVALPHKFKIAVGGCPNNCMKPDLNDFGLIGQTLPQIDKDKCRGCKKCAVESVCLMHAGRVVDGKIQIDPERCNGCGKCVKACYFGSISPRAHGVKIVLGGRWGREGHVATALSGVYSVEDSLDLLEKAILLYRKYGYAKERFGNMVERLGAQEVERLLTQEDLLGQKEEILAAPIRTRG